MDDDEYVKTAAIIEALVNENEFLKEEVLELRDMLNCRVEDLIQEGKLVVDFVEPETGRYGFLVSKMRH